MLTEVNPIDPHPSIYPRIIRGTAATLLTLLLGFCLGLPTISCGGVLITEVMSANKRTVLDEDRQPSDWIELFNTGPADVNLAGWHLTDDPRALNQWKFPDTPVKAGEHILVFASGKNRATAGRELHSNFKLDVDGEYLALVQPDGRTVVQQFKAKLPELRPDVSYGIPVLLETRRLVAADIPKWVLVPTEGRLDDSWRTKVAPGEGWSMGKGGIGFDATTNFLRWLGSDVGGVMKGRNSAVLIRVPFVLDGTDMDRLVLRMYYDDGFVAWINGGEVSRRNAPEALSWNSAATRARDGASRAEWTEGFDATEPDFTLTNGEAAARARVTVSSPDTNRFLRLVNGRLPDQINGVAFPQAIPTAPRAINVDFDFRIKGGSGSASDLVLALIPTREFEARGPGADLAAFRNGRDLEFRPGLAVRLSISPTGRDSEVTLHWNGAVVHQTRITDPSVSWRFYHSASLKVEFGESSARVGLVVRTDSRGGTGRSVVLLNDVQVNEAKPYPARLQVVGHTTSVLATIDLDAFLATWLPAADSLSEDIDLSPHLALLRPGTNILAVMGLNQSAGDPDFLILPELYGYSSRLQTGSPRYFWPSSPLTANQDPGYGAVAPAPTLSPAGGTFQSQQRVTLSTSVSGGVIRYTDDGKEPGESSAVYSGPIPVDTTTVIKARVFAPGYLPSPTALEAFTAVGADLADFNSSLPLVVLSAQGAARSGSRRTPLIAQFIDPRQGRAALKDPPAIRARGDFNIRGYSSTRYPKRSYTLRLRDEYGDKLKEGVLGMPKDSDWVLYAPYPDKTLMRDVLAYELFGKMGHYAPRTRFVELFLNRNGDMLSGRDYQGVYVVIEKIKRGKNRVDLQELGPGDNSGEAVTGGYIFKRDHSNDESPSFQSRGGEFFLVEPEPEDATPQQREYIERHFRALERSILGKEFMDPARGYRHYLDVASFLDQHWLIEMSKNIDGFRYSVIFSKDRGGKVRLEPPWDWNLSFGNANYHDGESPRGWYTEMLRDSEVSWFRRLVQDPEFNQRQVDRWWELRKTVFATDALLRRVDEIAAQLKEAQARNFKRWGIMGEWVHPNSFVGGSYEEEVTWMKGWIKDRIQWIDQQTPGPPAISARSDKAASEITIKGRGGLIYFTTDGSDPRAAGGEPSAKARAYESPVTLSNGAKLVARVKRQDVWSAPGVHPPAGKP